MFVFILYNQAVSKRESGRSALFRKKDWRKSRLKNFWGAGESCVLRGIVNHQVWLAQSVIVVKDEPAQTALLLLPGAECAFPEGYWRWRRNKDFSHGTRWQEASSEHIRLRKFAWQTNRFLIFLEPEKYYSCALIWEHVSDRFDCYYINFQLPYRRSHCGFDTLDLDLDIVIDPDYRWKWKDEDDYQEGIREGGIRAEWVQGIEHAQPEVFERISRRADPINGSWLSWRPDPGWAAPRLPESWQDV
jgi:protein associated with RNAse G/E